MGRLGSKPPEDLPDLLSCPQPAMLHLKSIYQFFGFCRLGLLLGFYGNLRRNATECEPSTDCYSPLHSMHTQQHLLMCLQEQGKPHLARAVLSQNPGGVDAENQEQDGPRDAPAHPHVFLLSTSEFHAKGRPDGQVEGSLAASLRNVLVSVSSVA